MSRIKSESLQLRSKKWIAKVKILLSCKSSFSFWFLGTYAFVIVLKVQCPTTTHLLFQNPLIHTISCRPKSLSMHIWHKNLIWELIAFFVGLKPWIYNQKYHITITLTYMLAYTIYLYSAIVYRKITGLLALHEKWTHGYRGSILPWMSCTKASSYQGKISNTEHLS